MWRSSVFFFILLVSFEVYSTVSVPNPITILRNNVSRVCARLLGGASEQNTVSPIHNSELFEVVLAEMHNQYLEHFEAGDSYFLLDPHVQATKEVFNQPIVMRYEEWRRSKVYVGNDGLWMITWRSEAEVWQEFVATHAGSEGPYTRHPDDSRRLRQVLDQSELVSDVYANSQTHHPVLLLNVPARDNLGNLLVANVFRIPLADLVAKDGDGLLPDFISRLKTAANLYYDPK